MDCYIANRQSAATTVFAVAGASYNLAWYKIEGSTITRLSEPTNPVSGYTCEFSNSGIHLGCGGKAFKRTLQSIEQIQSLIANQVNGSAWSKDDSLYAAVGASQTLDVWTRSGDTFTKIGGTLPTFPGYALSCDFSPDSSLISVGHYTTPYISTYSRSGDTFTKLTTNIPASGFVVSACKFSPNGGYFALGNYLSASNVVLYSTSGNTFTFLESKSDVSAGTTGLAWSSDSLYLAVASNTNYITVYKRSGTTFTKLSTPAAIAGNGQCICFSRNDNYLIVGHETSPYFTVYSRSGDTFTKLSNPATLPTSTISAASFATI